MNTRLLDIRIGRANKLQFNTIILLDFFVLEYVLISNPPLPVKSIALLFAAYLFILATGRRLRDLEKIDNIGIHKIDYRDAALFVNTRGLSHFGTFLDLIFTSGNAIENRHGLPPKGLDFLSMTTDGYPITLEEWGRRFKDTHLLKPINKNNSHEPIEAPVRESRNT